MVSPNLKPSLRWIIWLALSSGLAYEVIVGIHLATQVLPETWAPALSFPPASERSTSALTLVAGLILLGVVMCLEYWLRSGERQGVLAQRVYLAFSIEAGVLVAITVCFAQQLALYREIHGLLFPYPMDYGEGQILDQVNRLAHGLPIYFTSPATHAPPYTVANYPPFYQSIQVPLVWVFGTAFWYGRLIAILAVLMSGVSITLILHAITKNWTAGVLGGLTTLCMPPVYMWAPFERVDQLALGLSLAGLYIVVRCSKAGAGLVVAAACLVAAAYTKQSYALSAPLAAFAWLWSRNERRRAWVLAALVAGGGGVIFALLMLITRGSFYFNIVTATRGFFAWGHVFTTLAQLSTHLPLLITGSAVFVSLGLWRKVRPATWALVSAYLAGAVVETITIGKNGSNMNYLYELSAAFGLLAGAAIAWPPARRWRWATLTLIVLLATQIHGMVSWYFSNYGTLNNVFAERGELAELAQVVRETRGPVLADETMGLIPLAGKTVFLQPFEFKQLNDAGIWNDQATANDIYAQKYAAIVIRRSSGGWDNLRERWTNRQRTALLQAYDVTSVYPNNLVYTPKKVITESGLVWSSRTH